MNSVDLYIKVRDVLIYMANTDSPVTVNDLYDNVCDISESNVRVLLKQLVDAGLVTRSGTHPVYYHTTNAVHELYGSAKPTVPTSDDAVFVLVGLDEQSHAIVPLGYTHCPTAAQVHKARIAAKHATKYIAIQTIPYITAYQGA